MKVNEAENKKLFTTFLNLECGVLLDKNNVEYDVYAQAYDKKHGYYDETYLNGLEKDFEHLKQVGLDYVRNGVNSTYAVLTSIAVQGTEEDDFIANAIDEIKEYDFVEESIDFFDGEQFKAENVIWSAYKDEKGEIHEDFVEVKTEDAEEVEDEHEVEVPWGGTERREMPSDYERDESLKEEVEDSFDKDEFINSFPFKDRERVKVILDTHKFTSAEEASNYINNLDESLKEEVKKQYVWKKLGDDWALFERGKEATEENAEIILSRMNRYFPWSVYQKGERNKDLESKLPSDNLSDIKDYLKNFISGKKEKAESIKSLEDESIKNCRESKEEKEENKLISSMKNILNDVSKLVGEEVDDEYQDDLYHDISKRLDRWNKKRNLDDNITDENEPDKIKNLRTVYSKLNDYKSLRYKLVDIITKNYDGRDDLPSISDLLEESLKEGLWKYDYRDEKINELIKKYHNYENAVMQFAKVVWKEKVKEFPYWVVETDKTWDPEGLNIPSKNKIVFAGSEAECKKAINNLYSKAKADSKWQKVEDYKEDEFVTIYYPNAISKSTYYIMKRDDSANESLKESKEEEKLETFEDKMNFLAKDEQEAIDGYDKVLALLDKEKDAVVIEQLTKIKVEEEAHKKYLEDVKSNHDLVYTEPLDLEEGASYRGLAYYEYPEGSGCHVRETPSCFVAIDKSGSTLGDSQTKSGAEAIIDDSLKVKEVEESFDYNSALKDAYKALDDANIHFNVDKNVFEFNTVADARSANAILTRFFGADKVCLGNGDFNVSVELNESKKEKVIEMPHEEYTSPEDIKRINDELDAKAKEGKIIGIRKEPKLLMLAEPAINGIWTMYLNDEGYIEKIVLF